MVGAGGEGLPPRLRVSASDSRRSTPMPRPKSPHFSRLYAPGVEKRICLRYNGRHNESGKAVVWMELLKQRILKDGRALSEHVLLVDSFLNHQVDPELMRAVGEEFARRFADCGVTRVATIESSGIAPAVMTALAMGLPMVILKKSVSSILSEGILQTEVFSFTKNKSYQLTLKAQFVHPEDRVLLIDDFLANGEAAFGGIRLIERAGARVAGVGAVIAKAFQPGLEKLRQAGYKVEALAPVKAMGEGYIEFE